MQIGYITFNSEERQRVMKVLQMVRDQNAIDELGLGRIRDAFANKMFPGMSTLQRRAKYFAVLPSLYHEATKLKYRNLQEVRKQIIHWEIRLTEMLVNGCESPGNEKTTGITGSSTLEAAKRDETKYVKYDPTYIYQNGMRLYGMIRGNGSLEKLIFDQSELRKKHPERYTDLDTSTDVEEQFGIKQIFATCGELYDFEHGEELFLQLTHKEAAFIKNHIETSSDSKDSLLAYLLMNDIEVVPYFADFNSSIIDNLPKHFQEQYRLALHFSNWAKYMHLRYRYLFALGNHNNEAAKRWKKQMDDLEQNDENNKIKDSKRMQQVLQFIDKLVSEPTVKQFCLEAANLLSENKYDELDELIKKREKRIKPNNRHKIDNPKYINYSMSEPSTMSFRWNEIVYQVITDIRNYVKK